MHQRVDYDRIAKIYDDSPYRTKQVDRDLLSFIDRRPKTQGGLRILDIGCGTGSQLVVNRTHLPCAHLIGVDPFRGMLHQSKQKSKEIDWIQADGAHLPFKNERFDFITSQFSFHHVQDKLSMMSEVYRILEMNSRFVMINIAPQGMANAQIYRYFPAAWKRDVRDFLSIASIQELMRQVGFEDVEIERSPFRREVNLKAFYESVCQRHACSQLLTLSDLDYQKGIEQIESELSESENPVVWDEVCLVKVVGSKTC